MLEIQYRDMQGWARLLKQHYRLSFADQGKKKIPFGAKNKQNFAIIRFPFAFV
jgi:hypothetical protein